MVCCKTSNIAEICVNEFIARKKENSEKNVRSNLLMEMQTISQQSATTTIMSIIENIIKTKKKSSLIKTSTRYEKIRCTINRQLLCFNH